MISNSEDKDVDLTLCDREPIRIPGSVQPHGFYVAMRADDHVVVQVSANIETYTGKSAKKTLGGKFADVIGHANFALLQEALEHHRAETRTTTYLGAISLPDGGYFDALAHAADGLLVMEFEAVSRKAHADFRLFYPLIGSFLAKLNDADSVQTMTAVAAREIKALTGFGRVLVYRFDENHHGHVLAEEIDEGYHSYLNQRFPASDVPRQARELYLVNRIRLIPDANYMPSPLIPAENPLTGEPTDLSQASLRSVSPVHIRYMQNMGTLASMSVSIVIKGRLWGLISCHHAEPRSVPFEARAACEQVAEILALRIESKEDRDESHHRLELRRMLVSMLGTLSQRDDFVESIGNIYPELLRFGRANGIALLFEGRLTRFGETPSEPQILDLVQWLSVNATGEIFHTDALSSHYPHGADIQSYASGILALPISQIHRHYLIWFRPEVIKTIDWAGNPLHKVATGSPAEKLTPRMSFDIWRETVHGTSLPWRKSEIDSALEFRAALLGIVLERAEQMAELAEELGRANKELEAFSYSVSHDLRAPLRHIVGFSDLLLEFEGRQLSDRGTRFLKNIKDAARFAGKLVDDLLSFSQMGRAALRLMSVDMNDLVASSVERVRDDVVGRQIAWDIAPLPVIHADPTFLQLALYNLLSNAVKYTRNREEATISIWSEDSANETVFHVRDNGVGFSMDYVHKLFGVFQRLHRMEDFEGTGIGLANVRRIVERHGGRVWADAVIDQGATFSFAIPKHILTTDSDSQGTKPC